MARVGTKAAQYVGRKRGFVVFDEGDDTHDIRVLPCRYSAYLAIKSRGRKDRFGPVNSGSETDRDTTLDFWVPIHKLFAGDKCLEGLNLEVKLEARYFNQKIERLTRRLREKGFSNHSDDDLKKPDFRFEQGIAELDEEVTDDGPGILRPLPHPLVSAAQFEGEPLSFRVPPMNSAAFRDAFSPSLYLVPAQRGFRPWPEYAHVRERTDVTPNEDINQRPDVEQFAAAGEFDAQHYVDFAGDGWIQASVVDKNTDNSLAHDGQDISSVSAYSLVTAPDFFPNVDQRQVYEWWRSVPNDNALPSWVQKLVDDESWQGFWREDPEPLSDERMAANLALPDTPFRAGRPDGIRNRVVVATDRHQRGQAECSAIGATLVPAGRRVRRLCAGVGYEPRRDSWDASLVQLWLGKPISGRREVVCGAQLLLAVGGARFDSNILHRAFQQWNRRSND